MKGHHESALENLRKLRQGKFSETEIQEEMALIRTSLEREVEKGTFKDMFRNKQVTKRTMAVVGTNFFLQACGPLFSSVYGAYFIKQLGGVNPFTITTINSAVQIIGVISSMILVDKMGRR